VVREIAEHHGHIRGVLAQKPLGTSYAEACEIVRLCDEAGLVLAVNQNMRYDQSIRACKSLLDRGELGEPVLATIDMRAIPHWMPWQQRMGWVTLRIMSIHHLDAFRFLFGNPERVLASVRPDPRTAAKFAHEDGIALYILEYESGLRAASWDDVWAGPAREGAAEDIGIGWRVEGTEGMARGTIGWPKYPEPTPSTLDFTTRRRGAQWLTPRWKEAWFPDAFAGPMAQLLCALEEGREPEISGHDNLNTMALVEACYISAREHRGVELREIVS
jgi:predicted dehydrogenase